MDLAGLEIIKAGGGDAPSDFKCANREFVLYLDASAAYDQQQRMGQVYWAVYKKRVVGYMALAMGSAGSERQAELGIDTHGSIPALVITRLATDERYERRGIGRYMVSYAVRLARIMAMDAGCRIVLANSEPDATEFYEAVGFAKFRNDRACDPDPIRHGPVEETGADGRCDAEYVSMYIDMGLSELRAGWNDGPR